MGLGPEGPEQSWAWPSWLLERSDSAVVTHSPAAVGLWGPANRECHFGLARPVIASWVCQVAHVPSPPTQSPAGRSSWLHPTRIVWGLPVGSGLSETCLSCRAPPGTATLPVCLRHIASLSLAPGALERSLHFQGSSLVGGRLVGSQG